MTYLERERVTLESLMPGFDTALADHSLAALESPDSPALGLFRKFGGCGLVVAKDYGGQEASAVDMVRVQRALGSRSPSLAIATTMHTCTVIAVPACDATSELLTAIAEKHLFLASGFADGQISNSILSPKMTAERVDGGWRLTGRKAPCSLSRSMDYLTASVLLPPSIEGGKSELALVTIPAHTQGIYSTPFWNGIGFGGAENGSIRLDGVMVPDALVARFGDRRQVNAAICTAFLWFELFVAAAYLGVASALVERVLKARRGDCRQRMFLVSETEGAMQALTAVAATISAATPDNLEEWAATSLHVRYLVQGVIDRVTTRAVELLGGMAYLASPDVALLMISARALAFHPPSRQSIAEPLEEFVLGGPLILP